MKNKIFKHYILIPAVYFMVVSLAGLPVLLNCQQHDVIQEEVPVTGTNPNSKAPGIEIKGFSFKSGVLAFSVSGYLMERMGEDAVPTGKVKVRVFLMDAWSKTIFDRQKVFDAQSAEVKVSLGAFKAIGAGKYEFRIEATDMLTGKRASLYKTVTVMEK